MRIVGIGSTLCVNTLIVASVVATTVLLHEPLALLGLFALRELPIQVLPDAEDEPEEELSNPIGFVHHE